MFVLPKPNQDHPWRLCLVVITTILFEPSLPPAGLLDLRVPQQPLSVLVKPNLIFTARMIKRQYSNLKTPERRFQYQDCIQ
ncbi:hypothetical protein JYU34_000665 [Plutella xylostella]|uniref:Secreted protein n=1 Tax=Plutella xylostella TaxID=51655 RepID=A0ABQ7R899_PLUXY|nr:hypothetical protein JYU34_000665 [Plutella xylostella]